MGLFFSDNDCKPQRRQIDAGRNEKMARKTNYGFEKRQKEIAKKAKKEEKKLRKQEETPLQSEEEE